MIKNTPGKKSSYDQTPDKPTSKKSKKMEVPPPKSSPQKPIPKISPSTSKTTLSQSSVTDSQSSQKSLTSPLTQTPSGSPLVVKGNNESSIFFTLSPYLFPCSLYYYCIIQRKVYCGLINTNQTISNKLLDNKETRVT